MSLKVLVVLSLVALASASPAPAPVFSLIPTIDLRGILRIKGSDLGNSLSNLLGNIIGAKKIGKQSVNAILGIEVKDFNGVCDLTTKLVASLGDTIDATFRGMGNLISRIIFFHLRVIICFLSGLGNNPVCSNNINTLIGVSATAAVDIKALAKLYDLADVDVKVNALLLKYTLGGGINKCRGSTKSIMQLAIDLSLKTKAVISGKATIVKGDIAWLFRKISILIGAIGNSRKSGLGLSIITNYIPTCNKYLKIAGFVDMGDIDEVEVAIKLGNNDNGPWAIADVDASVDVNVSLGGLLSGLFKGIVGITRLAANLVNDIAKFVVNSIDSVFDLVLKIVLGIGGALDATISGLGSFFVRIVAGLLKIILCILGSGKYGVCKPTWEKQVGVTGPVTSIDLIITSYGMTGCRSQVNQYTAKLNAKVDVDLKTGSIPILIKSAEALADLVDSRKFDKTVVVTVLRHVTYCLGSIGNSNAKGVGTNVCNKFVPACNKYLIAEGYTGFGDSLSDITLVIEGANNADYTWSADIDNGDNRTGFISAVDAGINVSVGGSTGVSVGGSVDVSVGGLVGGILKGVFGTIKGVTNLALGALNSLLSIKIKALTDVFNVILNLSLIIQETLNNLFAGLGSFFSRLIACIIKIAICVKGFPGDRSICTADWNKKWDITGDAKTEKDLVILFGLSNCESDYNKYVSRCTNGRGITSSTPSSLRTVLEKIKILVSFILNYNTINKTTVTDTFTILTTVSCSIGNSQKRDSGKEIAQKIVPECGKYFKQQGYIDVSVNINIIINECAKSNDDKFNWNGGGNGGTTPSGGSGTTPSGGSATTPSGGSGTTPSGGSGTTPSGGSGTTPSGGSGTTPSGGSGTTPSGGGSTTKSPGVTGTTPSDVTETTPDVTDTTPSDVTETTPSDVTGTTTSDVTGTTPSDVTGTTPDVTGTTPSDVTGTTPSDVTGTTPDVTGTTPSDVTGTTPSDVTGTTPSDVTVTTPDVTETTPSDVTKTTPTDDNTGSTPSPGGDNTTTPSGDDNTTTSGGDTTPSGGDTTPSGGGTTPSGGGTTPSGGGTTPSGSGTTPSGGGTTTGPVTSDNCGEIISGVIKVIPGATKLYSNIIYDLVRIKIRTFVDIINLITNLTLALGGIIDLIFSGLGSIVVRIVAVIFKIGLCVNGYGNDRSICTKEWNTRFGVVGDSNVPNEMYGVFRVTDVKNDIANIINTYTGGKGISATSGFRYFVLQQIVSLGDMCSSGKVTKEDFSTVFTIVISIFGSITNSYTNGVGTDVCQKVVPICGPYFVKQGFPDVRINIKTIVTRINIGNTDKVDWKIIQNESNTKENQLVTNVKDAFKDVKDNTNVDKVSVNAVLNLEIPINFEGVLIFCVKVIQALGGILDVFISGLGSLLARIVGCLLHYIIAILGGTRYSKSFVSQQAFFTSFGLNVTTKVTTWDQLLTVFNCKGSKASLDVILNTYTKNKGLSALNPVEKLFFNCGYDLAAFIATGVNIKASILTEVIRIVTTALCGFANSCVRDLGQKIADIFIPSCSGYLKSNNYPVLTTYSASISQTISSCNNVKVPWITKTTVVTN